MDGKLPLGFKSLGEQQVKNIPKPIRVYRVHSESGAGARGSAHLKLTIARYRRSAILIAVIELVVRRRAERLATSGDKALKTDGRLPDKASTAVLPFANMSGDPRQDYFADGMTETIITDTVEAA